MRIGSALGLGLATLAAVVVAAAVAVVWRDVSRRRPRSGSAELRSAPTSARDLPLIDPTRVARALAAGLGAPAQTPSSAQAAPAPAPIPDAATAVTAASSASPPLESESTEPVATAPISTGQPLTGATDAGSVAPSPAQALRQPSALDAWAMPGLCDNNRASAADVQRLLRERFHAADTEDEVHVYLDPRVDEAQRPAIRALLDRSRASVEQKLKLKTTLPDTFVYADEELLRASACVNSEVVAFYDGALHIVAGRSDLGTSVPHELTHHALMSSGLRGPSWAQEGIAMHTAGETWWLAEARLSSLGHQALALDSMEDAIPYRLAEKDAVTFYVQAAAMVGCVLVRKHWTLDVLVDALRRAPDAANDVSELAQPALLPNCAREAAAFPTFAAARSAIR